MTRTLHIALSIFLGFYGSLGAFAQTDTTTKSSMDTRAELANNYEQINEEVKRLYSKTIALLDSIGNKDANNYRQNLTDSHKAWLIYSDSHCRIIAYQSRNAATGGDAFYSDCKASLNRNRIRELDELFLNLQIEFGLVEIK